MTDVGPEPRNGVPAEESAARILSVQGKKRESLLRIVARCGFLLSLLCVAGLWVVTFLGWGMHVNVRQLSVSTSESRVYMAYDTRFPRGYETERLYSCYFVSSTRWSIRGVFSWPQYFGDWPVGDNHYNWINTGRVCLRLPYWLLVVVLAVPCFLLRRKHGRTGSEVMCRRCSYNLTGNVSGVCPECGTPVPEEVKRRLASEAGTEETRRMAATGDKG